MGEIFITSDLHFGHNKPFVYEPRGFESIEEHDEEIVRRWNEVVGPEDTAYILGDLMLVDNERGMKCLKRLNGNLKIVLGNHDTTSRIELYKTLPNVEVLGYATVIKHNKHILYLSHYPTLTSNYDYEKPLKAQVINVCGHSHIQDALGDTSLGMIYHVELDAHDCYPVPLNKVIEDMHFAHDAYKIISKQYNQMAEEYFKELYGEDYFRYYES